MSSVDVKRDYAEHWFMQGYGAALNEVLKHSADGTLQEWISNLKAVEVDDGTEAKGSQ